MLLTSAIRRATVVLSLALGPTGAAMAQPAPAPPIGGPFTGPVVTNAPFSAEATAVLTETLADGTTRTLRVDSRYFRDSAGRVRLEQTVPGAGSTTTPAVFAVVQTDASSDTVHVLDAVTKTFRRWSRSMYGTGFGGLGLSVAVTPVRYRRVTSHEWRHGELGLPGADRVGGVATQALGTKQVAGTTTVGRRTTATVLTGAATDGGSADIIDEVWESPELRLILAARTADPRSGLLDYRVTRIERTEPSARLFEVPADYLDRPKTNDEPYEFLYEPARAPASSKKPRGR